MTPEELQEIQERCDRATPDPWQSYIEGRDCESGSSFIMTGIAPGENIWSESRSEDIYLTGATNADQDFVAHARQDIPRLVAEVQRLQQQLRELQKNNLCSHEDDEFLIARNSG
jgi:hypothetical protein